MLEADTRRLLSASRMSSSSAHPDYRLGSVHAIVTAFLLATQEPFSVLAAKRLSSPYFVGFTQFALLLSVPLLTLPAGSLRDFIRLLSDQRNLGRLLILFLIGLSGLLLYNLGLGSAHPIIVAVILNLSPFWAVLVTLIVSREGTPVSSLIFVSCFLVAFLGAMIVAWSQMDNSNGSLLDDLAKNFLRRTWMYAIPVPIFFALSGTLVGHWFPQFDEAAAIAANFLVSAFILIPSTLVISYVEPPLLMDVQTMDAVLLLMLGTLAAAAAGRVFYQVALTATGNDNGFVTMFFLLVPGLSALVSVPLSWWIPDLRFVVDPMFFFGLALSMAALFVFYIKVLQKIRPTA
jgi:drug/metabolite transporter (DMT)-like permease